MDDEPIADRDILLGLHKKVDRLAALSVWTLVGVAAIVSVLIFKG